MTMWEVGVGLFVHSFIRLRRARSAEEIDVGIVHFMQKYFIYTESKTTTHVGMGVVWVMSTSSMAMSDR